MNFFLCIFIGIAVNLDNFLIGINLAMKHQSLSLKSNLLISFISGLTTFIITFFSGLLSTRTRLLGNAAGSVFLILFGIYCLLKPDDHTNQIKVISLTKTLILGTLLSINCIPPAIFAGMLNLHPLVMGLSCGIFSLLSLYVGNRYAMTISDQYWTKYLSTTASCILIILGFFGLFF